MTSNLLVRHRGSTEPGNAGPSSAFPAMREPASLDRRAPAGLPGGPPALLTDADLDVLRATVLAGATDAQLQLYARSCAKRDLDPFSKEVYGFVTGDGGVELVVSIDGLRKQAEKTGEYRGQTGQQWCGADGEWHDIWLAAERPAAARITVHRAGHEPFTGVALWREYGRNQSSWTKYPTVMLSKCAEANAIRHLFPHQTGSLYIVEEMPERERVRPVVTGEVVGRTTGEITGPPQTGLGGVLSLDDDIKRLREILGWSAQDVIDEAARMRPVANLRTPNGKRAVADRLQEYVDAVEADGEGVASDLEDDAGRLIDAESRAEGSAGNDAYTAGGARQ